MSLQVVFSRVWFLTIGTDEEFLRIVWCVGCAMAAKVFRVYKGPVAVGTFLRSGVEG